jgi:predicted Zn-dependent protease
MDLVKFAQDVISLAAKKRLDDCELMVTSSRTLQARITNREVKLILEQDIFSAGIRILKDSGIGYLPLSEPDVSAVATGIDHLLADLRPFPLSCFAVIPDSRPGLECFDPAVARLLKQPRQLKDLARDLSDQAFAAGALESLEGSVAVQEEEKLVHTMHSGRAAPVRRTSFAGFADVNTKDFDSVASRRLPDLARVAQLGAELVRTLPKGELTPEVLNVKGKPVLIILHPYILEVLLSTLVAEHAFATTAQAGLSRYQAGATVAARHITLVDDALAPFMADTFPTDDEGTVSQRTAIIEGGVFKSYLHDRASAQQAGKSSTGHGKRRPILTEDENEAPVRASVRSLFLQPGAKPLEQMIRETECGILVKFLLGIHTANKTTGDFTNPVYAGKVIRHGRVEALTESGRWSLKGNALDLLKQASELSSDTVNTGAAVLPYLKTELVVC